MDVAFVRDIAGGVFCSAKVQGNGDGQSGLMNMSIIMKQL